MCRVEKAQIAFLNSPLMSFKMISLQDERFWSTLMNYMAGKYGRNANVIANSSCVCLAHACASHTGSTCLKFPAHKSGTKTWVRAFAARKVPHRTHRIQLLYGCCATVVRGLTEDTSTSTLSDSVSHHADQSRQ